MTVHPYRPEDLDALRALVLRLHESVRPFDADLAPGPQIIDAHFASLLQALADTQGTVFVAEDGGRPVGYCWVLGLIAPEDADEVSDRYAFTAELFVDEAYRRSGVGQLLMAEAEAHARRLGAYKMELKVSAGNAAALRFYEREGYRPRIVTMTKRL